MPKPTNSYRHLKPEDRMIIASFIRPAGHCRIARLLIQYRQQRTDAQRPRQDVRQPKRTTCLPASPHSLSPPAQTAHRVHFVWRCAHPDALTPVARANHPDARTNLFQGPRVACVTRDYLQLHLSPTRRRAAQRSDCLPAPGEQQTHAPQQRPRQARSDTGHALHPHTPA